MLTQGLFALGLGLLMRFVLQDLSSASIAMVAALLVVLVLWASNLVLLALFAQPYTVYFIGLLFALSAFFTLFDTGEWVWFLGTFGLLLLAGNYMRWKVQVDKSMLRQLHLRRMIPRSLPRFFTIIALVVAILFFVSPQFAQDEDIQYNIPRGAYDFMYPFMSPFVGQLFGDDLDINPRGSFTLESLGLSIQNLPQDIRELLPGTTSVETEIKVQELFYDLLNRQLNLMLGTRSASILPAFVAAGLFLGIKALTIPLMWIIIFVTASVIELLLKAGVLRRVTERAEIEQITL